ncbi:hypothetical protein H6G54_14760 [Anabaena cylindrica FACHB-243]|uniref:Uncharacterized protein n=1 Tax=Anabaena cylindrica (strain ATCC 27899 / PCC 7122) TaxID=272123 RepID=K9ZPR4_ANACC|nr:MULTISPECIES: hypothetical protein [Anabaena]AFZ60335.1 hypothetical protein Anacy_4995 [Anabaena cylindrica PCC 7122]MBD2418939.1 hypothetical protein [Anabaena cylindrica FACHB-243]MBY5285058.1 hypothetical protein [Anabaena sp. CCAP 1446/1C]MBY5310904.1 hypothetical protein [Anabaena sp. CCAP 1446/1C]MCM2404530.1 hypothetical protein [Anabaena sp. CCAP 1446/1C]
MKAGLKRIEATLHDLGIRNTDIESEAGEGIKRPFSFRISIGANKSIENKETTTKEFNTVDTSANTVNNSESQPNLFPKHNSVKTFPTQENDDRTPSLPKFKTPSFSNHRHGANPAFAMNMLQDIQETVSSWQTELQAILQQIQDIYLEGPVINGWLESNPQEAEPGGTATLRHAEVERLMDYVEEICEPADNKVSYQSSRTDYRLCGVDAVGKVWSRSCPVDQVPNVSMAIARYQKLRQLFGRKQYLETRLSQLAETLVALHSHIHQV